MQYCNGTWGTLILQVVCPYPEKKNHPGFVNISPTLVIDASMERSSRVLQHGKQKIDFFFKA